MNPLDPQVVHRLGWALVHFVWQGAALAALAAVMLRRLRRRTAAVRYLAACAALAAMVAAPVATLSLVPPAPVAAHRDAGEAGPGPEPMAAVVSAQPAADALAAPVLPRDASWAARLASAIEPVLPPVVLAWLIGALGVSVWYAGGWVWVRRLIWKRAQPAAERWRQAAADLARRMRVSRPVRILESAAVRVPTLVGCLRPVILLPASVLTGLAPEQIEALLAHELAHVRRWDYLVNLGQTVAEALFFYHPAVWWLSRRIRVEREQCCDDAVVATCGDRVAYARALATLGQSSVVPAAALAAGDGRLLARIRRILTMEPDTRNERGWGAVALVGIAAALVGVLAMTLCSGPAPAASAVAEGRPAAATLPVAGGPSVPAPSGADTLDRVPGDEVVLETWIMSLAPNAGPPLAIPLEGGPSPAEAAAGAPRPPRLLALPGTELPVVLTASEAERVITTLKVCPRVTVMSSPRVMSVDNREARVFVGSEDPVRDGVELTMTPHVDRERRQVTLDWRFVLWQRDPPNNRNEVSARVTLPEGGAVMLSGGTIPHPPKGNQRVYVLIRATTVVPKKSPAETSIGELQALRDREAAQKLAPHGQDAAAYREALALRPDSPTVTQILSLRHRDAADVADVLSAFFQGEPGAKEKASVIADVRRNAIIVRADPATIARIADLIQRIDRPPATASTRMPTVSAAPMSEEDKKRLEETNRRLDNDLEVHFSEMPLADVLQYLRDAGKLNIIVSPDLPASVLTRPLINNMNVKQVATKHILRIALAGSGLDYEVGPGYVLILARRTPEQADVFRTGPSTSIPQPPEAPGKVDPLGAPKR
jgi:beta-lactamase regulating signal transducer with metallopeptidase domain